jgi:branched-chain amino acid transport system ATP-binding protein
VLALVGANGAGKTTLLRTIAGAHRPASGRIVFDGRDLAGVPPYERVKQGITLVPEGRRLFSRLTVEENLRLARRKGRDGEWDVDSVIEAFPLLKPLRGKRTGRLSGGEQQATAIGRALVANPRLLLLDEVSLGLAPVAVSDLYRSLERVLEGGSTIVLVEQDLGRAMDVADRIVCMLEGRMVLEGAPKELSREQVREAYFGLAGSRHDEARA